MKHLLNDKQRKLPEYQELSKITIQEAQELTRLACEVNYLRQTLLFCNSPYNQDLSKDCEG